MKNITIGHINEKKHNGNIVYSANFYDGFLKEQFDNKDDMLDFIAKEGESLFSSKESYKAAIKYTNIDEFSHYFLIKKSNDDVIIGEQSIYEFNETQAYLFKPDVNRRVVNDRYYNFSDMVRSAANFKTTMMLIKVLLFVITGAISVILLIDTLDFIDNEARSANISDKSYYKIFTFINTGVSVAFSLIGFFSLHYAVKVFNEENTNVNYFDFRIATRRRQRYRIINLFLQLSAAVAIILFAHKLYHDGHYEKWDSLAILLTINASMLFITIVFQVIYISSVYINMIKVVRKYFKDVEFKIFWKWYRTGKPHDLQNSNEIFLLSFEDSSLLYTKEYEIAAELIRTDTKKELKEFSSKQKKHILQTVLARKSELVKGK